MHTYSDGRIGPIHTRDRIESYGKSPNLVLDTDVHIFKQLEPGIWARKACLREASLSGGWPRARQRGTESRERRTGTCVLGKDVLTDRGSGENLRMKPDKVQLSLYREDLAVATEFW